MEKTEEVSTKRDKSGAQEEKKCTRGSMPVYEGELFRVEAMTREKEEQEWKSE